MIKTGPVRGDFPSLKLGRMVRYGSTIERDLLYFLEYWQSVTWYREQPMTIEYTMADGKIHRYTPDYEIHEGTVKTLIECKPEAHLASKHAHQQRQIGKLWAEDNGYRFITFTDSELRSGYQLSNLKLLWRYARLQVAHRQQIVEKVGQKGRCSVQELCHLLDAPPHEIIPAICNLLFHHRLQIDLSEPFAMTTSLWVGIGWPHGTDTD